MPQTQLSQEQREEALKFNRRARQLFWRGILPNDHPFWSMDEKDILDWTLEFQERNRLRPDGRFGPSCLMVFMAEKWGGIGGFIIDGREISIPDTHVIRLFKFDNTSPSVHPDVACILSTAELDFAVRDRLNGKKTMRAHFSIDSSEGIDDESLILQWADPMRQVPFCPVTQNGDYPMNRQCVGIEIETVINMCQMDSDERRWIRRRPTIHVEIDGKNVHHPDIYPSQVKAFKRLTLLLEKEIGIPLVFPHHEDRYATEILDDVAAYRGYLAKFHYLNRFNEPGGGFVNHLDEIFGKLSPSPSQKTNETIQNVEISPKTSTPLDIAQYESRKKELDEHPSPTSSFLPQHEDTPRFNLANAIAAAYSSGKAARASRIADKCRQFDES